MYQRLTKLFLAGVVAVTLLALGSTSMVSPAWAQRPTDQHLFDFRCKFDQVLKALGGGFWQCADDSDTLGDVRRCDPGNVIEFDGARWRCISIQQLEGTLSAIPRCKGGNIIEFDGGEWACVTPKEDADTLGDIAECIDGDITVFDKKGWKCASLEDFADTLGEIVGCVEGDVIEFDGSEWTCVPPGGMKTVFATSATYLPNLATAGGGLNGLSGADNICNAHAAEGIVPPGHYIAWLSTSKKNARDRLPPNDQGYVLPDGVTVVADSMLNLLSFGGLEHAIDQDEQGITFIEHPFVWTGTGEFGEEKTAGLEGPFHCDDWTVSEANTNLRATVGQVGAFPDSWATASVEHCGTALHLFCFER